MLGDKPVELADRLTYRIKLAAKFLARTPFGIKTQPFIAGDDFGFKGEVLAVASKAIGRLLHGDERAIEPILQSEPRDLPRECA